jgi:hypothetical protein
MISISIVLLPKASIKTRVTVDSTRVFIESHSLMTKGPVLSRSASEVQYLISEFLIYFLSSLVISRIIAIGMNWFTNCARDNHSRIFDAAIRFDDSMERAVFQWIHFMNNQNQQNFKMNWFIPFVPSEPSRSRHQSPCRLLEKSPRQICNVVETFVSAVFISENGTGVILFRESQ